MFLSAALSHNGIPFPVKLEDTRKPSAELREALEDARLGRNLHGPFLTAEEAVNSIGDL
jgi:DNA-damage-inducible protein J